MKINNHTARCFKRMLGMKVNESQIKSSRTVNINNLMSKVRADYKKQKK